MKSFKHIGRLKNTGSRVLVVFRTLPGEADHALVLPVSNLSPSDHDTIMSLVETIQAQESFEFGEIMFIRSFSDGRPMLAAAQADNLMMRIPTDQIVMTPNTQDEILLSELNVLIAEQKNCAIDDLYTFVKGAVKVDNAATINELGRDVGEPNIPAVNEQLKESAKLNEPLSDQDIAKGYRSQADALYKEAALLRKQAEELDPKPKKATAKKATAAKAKTTKAKATKSKKAKADVSD